MKNMIVNKGHLRIKSLLESQRLKIPELDVLVSCMEGTTRQ